MQRLLRFAGVRFNYLHNFKKPIVEIPTTKPPKYIYQIQYHPSAMPDLEMRFKDHVHFNEWLTIVYGQEDKYEFQYSGQWWEAVSVPARLFLVVLVVGMVVGFNVDAEERKRRHLPGVASHYEVGDIPGSQLPTIIQN